MDIKFLYPASAATAQMDAGIVSIVFSGFPNEGSGIRVGLSIDSAMLLRADLDHARRGSRMARDSQFIAKYFTSVSRPLGRGIVGQRTGARMRKWPQSTTPHLR